MPDVDTPLLGRVGVSRRTRGKWRELYRRWTCVSGGKELERQEFFGKLTVGCGKRQWERLENEGQERARHKAEELRTGTGQATAPAMGLQEGTLAFLCHIEDKWELGTVDAYQRLLDAFLAFLAGQPNPPATVAAVTQQQVDLFAAWRQSGGGAGRPLKDSTLRGEMFMLGAFFKTAVKWKWGPNALEMPEYTAVVARTVVPEDEEVFAALAEPDPVRRAAFAVLALTGVRSDELMGMPASAWQPGRMRLDLPETGTGRTKIHGRVLPVGPTLAGALDVLTLGVPDGFGVIQPPGAGTLNRWLKPYRLTPKLLRRWFCTSLERMGCPDYAIRRLMGHSAGATRGAYSGYRASDAEEWMLRLDAKVREGVTTVPSSPEPLALLAETPHTP